MVTHNAPPAVLESAVGALLETLSTPELESIPISVHMIDNGGSARARLEAADVELAPADGARVTLTEIENRGFAHAVNTGCSAATSAGASVVVCLNDDVITRPGWLLPLLDSLDARSDLGAVQPLLVSVMPGGAETVNSAGVVLDGSGAASDIGRGEDAEHWSGRSTGSVAAVTGGAMAIRAECWESVGGLDERFFLYYEDVEWCRRASADGWEFAVVFESVVEHLGSATTEGLGDRRAELLERNRLWCTAMTGDGGTLLRGLWLSVRRLRHTPRAAHARGLLAGIAGIPSRLVRRWNLLPAAKS